MLKHHPDNTFPPHPSTSSAHIPLLIQLWKFTGRLGFRARQHISESRWIHSSPTHKKRLHFCWTLSVKLLIHFSVCTWVTFCIRCRRSKILATFALCFTTFLNTFLHCLVHCISNECCSCTLHFAWHWVFLPQFIYATKELILGLNYCSNVRNVMLYET